MHAYSSLRACALVFIFVFESWNCACRVMFAVYTKRVVPARMNSFALLVCACSEGPFRILVVEFLQVNEILYSQVFQLSGRARAVIYQRAAGCAWS